jgi:hypothetical protein
METLFKTKYKDLENKKLVYTLKKATESKENDLASVQTKITL